MKNNLNIVFFGTPDFAMPVLDALIRNGYNVSRFPKKSLKDETVFEEFKSLKPDLCVVAAYGKILPARYLDVPKHGFVNVHPSLLPKYRGPSPVQTAILNGDNQTGASIMIVDKEIDHGPILASEEFSISNGRIGHHSASLGFFQFSNHNELAKELFTLGAKLLIEVLPKYLNGEIKPVDQDHSQATFTKMFTRKDGHINWPESNHKIYNQIRALNPEPGTWSMWKNKVINIFSLTTFNAISLQVINLEPEVPGIVRKLNNDIVIRTGTGYLILKSIQLEGGKEMDVKSFLNGHPDFLGSVLE